VVVRGRAIAVCARVMPAFKCSKHFHLDLFRIPVSRH
jgi:hypothetical protein